MNYTHISTEDTLGKGTVHFCAPGTPAQVIARAQADDPLWSHSPVRIVEELGAYSAQALLQGKRLTPRGDAAFWWDKA